MSRQALEMALEALELCNGAETVDGVVIYTDKEITAIKEALAQPEQEPVAWTVAGQVHDWSKDFSAYRTQHYVRPVFTIPPQRKPLTDEQIIELANSQGWNVQVADLPANLLRMRVRDLGRAIEAAHGINKEKL